MSLIFLELKGKSILQSKTDLFIKKRYSNWFKYKTLLHKYRDTGHINHISWVPSTILHVEWTYGVHLVARNFSHLGAKTITNHGEMWTFSGDWVYAVSSNYFSELFLTKTFRDCSPWKCRWLTWRHGCVLTFMFVRLFTVATDEL